VRVRFSRIPTSSEVGLDVAAYYNEARLTLHTHFVRSGYVMLRPISGTARSNAHNAGYNITDPLLTKWVCAKARDVDAHLIVVGCSITDPPLTRLVCAKTDAHPLLALIVTRQVMGRRDTRGTCLAAMGLRSGAVPGSAFGAASKVGVPRPRAPFLRLRLPAHEGVRVESLEIRGD
jgi:hypothetical protein